MKRIIKFLSGILPKKAVPATKLPEVKHFVLNAVQAELVKKLLCDDELDPAVMASRFYKRYSRRLFENLFDYDPLKEERYLTDPDLFLEGCELAESAMRVLGDITEENGKEYINVHSPFITVMQRAFYK